jgi:hypothetical protein
MSLVNESSFLHTELASLMSQESQDLVVQACEQGLASIESFEVFAKVLLQLPNTGVRLRWDEIPHLGIVPPKGLSGTKAMLEIRYNEIVQGFVINTINYFDLSDRVGIFFEDYAADCAIKLDFKTFLKLIPDFFHMPGHKYFVAADGGFLLNITHGDDVYFTECAKLIMPKAGSL